MYHTQLANKQAKPLDLFQQEVDPQQYDFPPTKRKTPMNFKIPTKSRASSIKDGLQIQTFKIKPKSQPITKDEDVVQVKIEDYLHVKKDTNTTNMEENDKKEDFVTFSQLIKQKEKTNSLLEPVKKLELKPSIQTLSEVVIPSPKSTRKIEEPSSSLEHTSLPQPSTQQPIVIKMNKPSTRPVSASVISSKQDLYTIDQTKPWFHRTFHIEETIDRPKTSYYQTMIPQASDWMYQKLNESSQTRIDYFEKLLTLIESQKEEDEQYKPTSIRKESATPPPIPLNVRHHEVKSQEQSYVHELALQRRSYSDFIDALRYQEQVLLEQKREEEMEKNRGPFSKWFEIRDSRFSNEAQKLNNKTMTNGYYKTKMKNTYHLKPTKKFS